MDSHTLITSDGIRLFAETAGAGDTMLLCNGLFCSTHYFEPWWNHFSMTHHLVQFDYRSHGASDDDPDPDNVTISKLVDDASLVLETLCPEKTILVGHSMGVRIALELFHRHPQRFSHLILLCGSVFDALGPIPSLFPIQAGVLGVLRFGRKFTPLARGIKDLAVRRDLVSRIGYAFGGLSRTLTPRKPVEELLRHVDRVDIGMMASLARSYILHSARDILPCVNVPALYLVGEKDSLAPPSHARKVVGVMPSAQAHVLADCTHLALVEKPKEVHALVETFFERG